MTTRIAALTSALFLSAALVACGKKDDSARTDTTSLGTTTATVAMDTTPIRVSDIQAGKAVGADKRISDRATTFGVRDTIYVSVITDGTGKNVQLGIRLLFHSQREGGNPVSEVAVMPSVSGTTVTDFHLTMRNPWPKGNYKVEVTLNGVLAGTRDIEVK
jgi:hypothetical protein